MERRKLAPSCTTFKDKYTRGQVRTVRVRDADMLLKQIEQVGDAEYRPSIPQSGDAVDKRAGRASRELAAGLARPIRPVFVGVLSRPWPPSP